MSKFILTAQLQLQAPTNTSQVLRQIQSQLQGVKVDLQLRNAQKAETEIRGLSDSLEKADKSANKLGGTLRASIRRFTALAIATRAVSLFTNTIGKAIESAIDFERELIKVSQVTGKTLSELRSLTNEINRLSTSFGVSSQSILSVGRILSQAGLDARETQVALSALAKTELAPTFDDITQTAEGAVAIFNQFKQGAGSLEAQLGSLNAVAGQFAVESGDLISVIRRTGGVFKQAGGDLNELIALFTSVRSTTRESAESIATGLRTIFTRIQRPETIKYLEQFGVKLLDLEGKFIGPYRAVGELNKALSGLEEGDITFVAIAEELGGFRQIGKVLPLIKEYAVAQEALKVAQAGSNSLAADAATAQASLAIRIVKVKEEFLALIRSISETRTFQIIANGALNLASAFLKVAEAVKPLIPLIGALAGIKLAKGLAGMFGGFLGGGGKLSGFNKGGKVHAFATGGLVPGTGNSDTVPAMLTPGEFVVRKSSVAKLGANNLAAMNQNRYANGGKFVPIKITGDSAANPQIGQISPIGNPGVKTTKNVRTTLGEAGIKPKKGESPNTEARLTANVKDITLGEESGPFSYDEVVKPGLQFIDEDIKQSLKSIGIKSTPQKIQNDKAAQNVVSGYAFESFAAGILGKTAEGGSADFDFINPSKSMSDYTKTDPIPRLLDAKNTLQPAAAIAQKAFGYKKRNPQDISFRRMNVGGLVQEFANGGKAKDFGKIGFRSSANEIRATYIADGNRSGSVTAVGYGPSLYTVSSSSATKGYGPKLYDVVMELATANGSMLTSDRSSVSKDAQRVWEYYFKNRNDVTKQPLDPSLWTKNQSLIPPELYGDKETWPPKTNPAWVLQSGYKKPQRITTDPSRAINLNDPDNLEKLKASKSVQKKQFGGIIQKFKDGSTGTGVAPVRNRMGMTPEQVAAAEERKRLREQAKTGAGGTLQLKSGIVGGLFLQEGSGGKSGIDKSLQGVELPGFAEGSKRLKASIYTGKLRPEAGQAIRNELKPNITQAVQNAASSSISALEISPLDIDENAAAKKAVNKIDLTSIEGYIFEAFTSALTGLQLSDAGATFDYVNPSQRAKERVGQLFSSGLSNEKLLDAKRTLNTESVQSGKSSIANKIISGIKGGLLGPQDFQRFATGGMVPGVGNRDTVPATLQAGDFVIRKSSVNSIGAGNLQGMAGYNSGGKATDVPALLTPGEFVFSRKQAQGIGYGNLNRMNKVGKYAKGGVVQRFVGGGVAERIPAATSTGDFVNLGDLKANAELVSEEFEKSADKTSKNTDQVSKNTKASKEGFSTTQKVFAGMTSIAFAMGQLRPNIDATSGAFTTGTAAFVDALTQLSAQAGTAAIALEKMGVRLDATNLSNLFTGEGKTNINLGRLAGRQAGKVATGLGFDPATARAFGKNIAGAVTKLTPFIAGLTATIAVTGLLNSALTTFYNYQQRINKAVQEGDVDKAGDLAAGQASLESANTLRTAGAGIGSVVGTLIAPGIGTAIGAVIGGIGGTLINSLASVASYIPFVGKMFRLAGDRARALAEAEAGNVKVGKLLETSTAAANKEMEKFKNGLATAADVVKAFGPTFEATSQNLDRSKAFDAESESGFFTGKSGTASSFGRGALRIGTLGIAGLMGVESGAQRNERLDKQAKLSGEAKVSAQRAVSQADPAIMAFSRQVIAAGGDFEQVRQSLINMKDENGKAIDVGKNYLATLEKLDGGSEDFRQKIENMAQEVAKAKAALEAMTLGFTGVNGAANATALSLNNYLNAQNAGYSGLSNSLSTLEASVTSAAQGISSEDFEASLGNASNVLAKFGATDKEIQKFEDNMRGVNAAQKSLPDAFKEARSRLQAEVARGVSGQTSSKAQTEAIQSALVDNLQGLNISEDVKKSLTAQINNIKFEDPELEAIQAGNFDILEKKLQEIGGKQLEQVKNAIQKEIEIQQKINETVQKRLDLEDKYVQAQQRAVDIMMEMKEGIAKFGGAGYTPEQRSADIVQSYNVQAEQAGITGLQAGSPSELNRTTAEITSELDRIANVRLAAGGAEAGVNGQRFTPEQQAAARQEMEGESGVNLEKQQARLNSLLEKQYSTTKALIDQKIKELNLIKEKNKLEKAAMDDLIAGDMEAFFDKMAAQGAQAALATGDERLINLYGGQAIGQAAQENRRLQEAGVTELYGQKLAGPGGLTERGFQAVADRAGIADPTFAQAAAGTTVEEAAAEKQIRELYSTLEPLAKAMEKSASNDLEVGKQMEAAAKQLGGAATVLHDAAVKLGGDPNAQPQQAGGGGASSAGGAGGAANAGQAAVNQANVNAQTAVINVNNAQVSGGGGGLISGTLSAAASNPAGTAQVVNQVVKRLPSIVKAAQPVAGKVVEGAGNLAGRAGKTTGVIVDDIVSKFAGGRAAQRSISGGLPGAQKAQGLFGRAGGLFERLNQASLGDDFNPNMLQRGKNLLTAGRQAAGGFVGNARNAFNVGKKGYDLAGLGYDTTKLSKTAKVSNFVGRTAARGQQAIQPLLSRGKQAVDFTRNLAKPTLERGKQILDSSRTVAKPLLEKASPYVQKATNFGSNVLKTGQEFISRNAPKAASLGDDALKGIAKFAPQVSKVFPTLANGASTVAKGFGKVLPGLGTVIDGFMEAGSFISDPKAYNADKIEKTTRDFGGMLESWGLGSLQTGITAVDGSLATLVGGLEGFLNPVGKIVEGAYNIVGGFQDAATLMDSSIKVSEQEKKTSESMSETTRKRAEEAGYTGGTENYDKLSALEKSAAQAEANSLFRKGEAERIAESGGTSEDYRKSIGMDKQTFADAYGEGANIQDIIKSEQQYAETQKEERRAKAKENRTYGEYFSGTDVESRSDTAVKEQLAIRQAEARKRREEAAAQQQAPPEVTATGGVQAAGGVTDTRPAIVNPTPYMDFNNPSADITPEQQANINRFFTSGQKEHLDNWQKQQRSQKQEVQQYKQEESTSKQIKGAIPAANESVYRKEQAQQSGQPSVGIDPELLNKFSSALEKFNSDFSANIDRLENTKFKIELAPTNINVNLTGGSFLESMKDNIKQELLAEVARRMQNQGFNPDGSPRSTNGSQLG